ncbi:MAG: hypothetical protein QM757_10275 [Paludibaculum sp.]
MTPNPKRAMLLWLNEAGELWVAGFDGAGQRRIETPAGRVLQAFWSPDGQALQYLLEPAESNQFDLLNPRTGARLPRGRVTCQNQPVCQLCPQRQFERLRGR